MKHQFVLFRDVENPTKDSVVYHVWVSDSPREKHLLPIIEKFAQESYAWFQRWNECVDLRLGYLEERVFWSEPIAVRRFKSTHISARDMVALIQSGSFTTFEENIFMPKIFFRIMWQCYPSAPFMPKSGIKANTCPASPRKYLSQRGRRSVVDAVIGMGIVTILFLVQMILDAVEKNLLY